MGNCRISIIFNCITYLLEKKHAVPPIWFHRFRWDRMRWVVEDRALRGKIEKRGNTRG